MKTTTAAMGSFCLDNLEITVHYGPRPDGLGDVTIKTLMYCPDLNNPDVRTDLRGEMAVTAEQVARQGIAYWVRLAVQNAVEHEVDEWLRVDGARVFPPHD